VALEVFVRVLLPIVVVVGAGFLLRRRLGLDVRSVNRVSIYLLSPALIFVALTEARLGAAETLRLGTFVTVFVLSIGVLTWSVSRALGYDTVTTSALTLCAAFMNAGNYGLPLSQFAFGEEGFRRAVVFFVVQAVLTQTLAIYIAGAGRGGWRGGLARLGRMPHVYAVLAALLFRWRGIRLDEQEDGTLVHLFRGVELLSDAAVPVLLIVLGLQLAESRGVRHGREVALATVVRLLVSVPLAFALARLLHLDELSTRLAIVLSSMPTAVNVSILAVEFDVRPRLVSDVVLVSTALSFVTLTLLLLFLGTG